VQHTTAFEPQTHFILNTRIAAANQMTTVATYVNEKKKCFLARGNIDDVKSISGSNFL